MTRNLYLGADLDPVVIAAVSGDLNALFAAVSDAWATIVGTDFHARAEALADEIKQDKPMLVGLQEVTLYRTGPVDGVPLNATNVEYDYLEILLDELNKRDLHYAPVALPSEDNQNFDVEVPGDTDVSPDHVNPQDIRLTDHDVILARTDLPDSQLKLSNVQTANFATNASFPIGGTGQSVTLYRGWGSVDVSLGGHKFRLINTHLEQEGSFNQVQVAQGNEILNGPADTDLPVILVGDFNSRADGPQPPGTPTYDNLIAAGFTDAWNTTHPGEMGNTWGHEEELLNKNVNLTQRLDLVLFRDGDLANGLCASDADVVGDELNDRIRPSGLWPSDHAGVVAKLRVD
jgi:hypothetical protein